MPSLQDVADQINAKLDQIITNTAQSVTIGGQIRTELQNLNSQVATLDADVRQGFGNLAGGLFAIWEVEKAELAELRHHTDQNDTVICLLRNTNDLLCGITRKLTTEIEISQSIADAVQRIEGIAERVDPAAAADFDRLAQLRAELAECCPPEPPQPEPCPEDCPTRSFEPYDPTGQDWEPLPEPGQEPGPNLVEG